MVPAQCGPSLTAVLESRELCFSTSAEAMLNAHIWDLMPAYDKTLEAFMGWAFTPAPQNQQEQTSVCRVVA